MRIDLDKEIKDHFRATKRLSKEASQDEEESFGSRAAAMRALSSVLEQLTKSQEAIHNMERMVRLEQLTIEILEEYIPADKHEELLNTLQGRLNV